MDLVKEHGWDKHKAVMISLWPACKSATKDAVAFRRCKGLEDELWDFWGPGRMSISTSSSSAPWSWTSESDFERDYDLTIVQLLEVSLGTPGVPE